MPNQCVHCSKIYPDGSEEVLKGCSCGSKFFFYITQERLDKSNQDLPIEFKEEDKSAIEKDIRDIILKTEIPKALKDEIVKEYDKLKVKLRVYELKHLGDEDWYDSSLPVYTCQSCEQQWVMERVNK